MIGQRLKLERERIGKTQTEFAAIAGVGKTTVINWEKDGSSPTAVQLAALRDAEVDVFYVLTGQRASEAAASAPAPISRQEAAMLDNFRHCSEEGRRVISGVAAEMAKPCEVTLRSKSK